MTDIFHLFFGLAALSLIDHEKYDLELIDPLFAIPRSITGDLRKRLEKDLCDNQEMVPKKELDDKEPKEANKETNQKSEKLENKAQQKE